MKKRNLLILSFTAVLVVALIAIYPKWGLESPSAMDRDLEMEGEHPGWYEQWYQMKKDENGEIPRGLYKMWSDYEIEKNAYANKKGVKTGLDDVKELGPNHVGGRTRDLIIDINNEDHIIAGSVSGGIWESFNGGKSWKQNNDQSPNLNVTAITQNPFNGDVIYYGTGEGAGNSTDVAGEGIFKSTDGGKTYAQLPATLKDSFDYIWDIEHSLVDSNTIYVSTNNRGLLRSINGGRSFHQILQKSTDIHDVDVFPDGSVLCGVKNSGIFYSPDGSPGSFVEKDKGLPNSGFNRIELSYCKAYPKVVYAVFGAGLNGYNGTCVGVWKSSNGGKSWAAAGNPGSTGENFGFTWYCLAIGVHPTDSNFVTVGSAGYTYTANGGKTWKSGNDSHADYHVFKFKNDNSDVYYAGNDGGVYEYTSKTVNSTYIDRNKGYNVTQFYAGSYYPQGDLFIAGAQDNGTWSSQETRIEFKKLTGGDGAYCQINQQNPEVAYTSSQNGAISKTGNLSSGIPQFTRVVGEMDANFDGNIDDGAYFINPFEMNYLDGNQLFFPTPRRLFVTYDGGGSWNPVTNMRSNVYCVGISNEEIPSYAYTGGNNLQILCIKDPLSAQPGDEIVVGKKPNKVSTSYISCITVHPRKPGTIFIGLSDYKAESRAWRIDGANTDNPVWTELGGDLPTKLPVNWIEVDPFRPDSFFVAATDFGIYTSRNGGKNWVKDEAFPNVAVMQLRIRYSDRKVFFFTHGRGGYVAQLEDAKDQYASIDKTATLSSIKIYPNPSANYIQVEAENNWQNTSFSILDPGGKLVSTGKFSGQNINTSTLQNGAYILIINDLNGIVARNTFVVNH